jgi:16S rRNA (guanine966-N2)-methyltransferase
MRIIAGSAKGVRLGPIPAGTRPMSDRAREGIFSSLGTAVEGARVLDLFAGTGAAGIEALSRGASSALFVDSSPAAIATVQGNLRRAKLTGSATVRRADAVRAVREQPGPFDLVILDPPYRFPEASVEALLEEIAARWLAVRGGRVLLTRHSRSYTPVIPVHWRIERQLSYGDAVILVFQVQ